MVKSERIENFNTHQSNDDEEINEIIRKTRPYSSNQFIQNQSYKEETNNSCEFVPSANFIRYENLLNGMSFYYDEKIEFNSSLIEHGKQLSFVLSSLCRDVFHLSIETIHLFRDIDSGNISFTCFFFF